MTGVSFAIAEGGGGPGAECLHAGQGSQEARIAAALLFFLFRLMVS
jgi:hypothetical protein